MNTETIEVHTPRGTMPVYVTRPVGGDRAPLIVLLMDAPGIRPALHAHAGRLATAGYMAALPDLFFAIEPDARPRPERLAAGDAAEFERMGAVVARMDDDHVVSELALLLDALPETDGRPWGCVGFCMGGRFALRAAEAFGDELAAAAMLHPSRIVTDAPDSPHRGVDRISAGLYFGMGERDHVTPPTVIPPLRDQLEEHGIAHRIDVLEGADHGYSMPGMPAYNETAAELAWAATLELLGSRLR